MSQATPNQQSFLSVSPMTPSLSTSPSSYPLNHVPIRRVLESRSCPNFFCQVKLEHLILEPHPPPERPAHIPLLNISRCEPTCIPELQKHNYWIVPVKPNFIIKDGMQVYTISYGTVELKKIQLSLGDNWSAYWCVQNNRIRSLVVVEKGWTRSLVMNFYYSLFPHCS